MKISVKLKPQARQDKVEAIDADSYMVWVKAKAVEGQANQAAAKLLAEYFNLPKSQVMLIKGKTSRNKVFAIG